MRRVLVTGVGVVAPIGVGAAAFGRALKDGSDGIGPVTLFDVSDYPTKVAAEVRDWRPTDHLDDAKAFRRLDRFAQFALVAAHLAIDDAGLDGRIDADRTGVLIGSGIGGAATIQEQDAILRERGPGRVSPFFVPMVMINMAAAGVAIRWGLRGPTDASSTACATGTQAIGRAFEWVRSGRADVMLAGGAEATVNPLPFAGFCAARAMSQRTTPDASCPFDRRRDGFVMGEGAGVVVLETEESVRARGAEIYCEVAGYGASCDAHHITAPPEDGAGALAAMRAALDDAGARPGDVTLVSAHATSTPVGDAAEAAALIALLGDRAGDVPVTALKSQIGHLLGAAGAVAAAATAIALRDGFVPPTIHLAEPDGLGLEIPTSARPLPPGIALSNAFGFGGANATLAFRPAS